MVAGVNDSTVEPLVHITPTLSWLSPLEASTLPTRAG